MGPTAGLNGHLSLVPVSINLNNGLKSAMRTKTLANVTRVGRVPARRDFSWGRSHAQRTCSVLLCLTIVPPPEHWLRFIRAGVVMVFSVASVGIRVCVSGTGRTGDDERYLI